MELGLRAVLSQELLEQVLPHARMHEDRRQIWPGARRYLLRLSRARREFDDSGEPVRGLRSIETDEAATILWILEQYADDMSAERIADELNARGVGRPWQGTAIRGHRNRGSCILNNQGYIGRIVFNRLAYRKKSRDRTSGFAGECCRAACRAGSAVAQIR
jgi:hypothetical protein